MIFRTNAKCEGCLARIEETLQGRLSRGEWTLDLTDPDRPLTVTSDKLSADEIVRVIGEAGFRIEPMSRK